MGLKEDALELHRAARGKLAVMSKVPLRDTHDLSLAYSPGVAEPCLAIADHPDLVDEFTSRWNLVAVVSDGSAVLGLGNIGPKAALPVMEGKAVLFKNLAGVDAFPICLATQDPRRIVETVLLLEPTFGGVNLEDIAAPACFVIERELRAAAHIPIFHDDQHGTAVVSAAGLINALQVTGRAFADLDIIVSGAGASAIACAKLLLELGAGDVTLVDSRGVIYAGRDHLNEFKAEMAVITNRQGRKGTLAEALRGANCFLGLSSAGLVTRAMVETMQPDPILFPLANPDPEIRPEEARAAGARVIGTGRSDYPNQINNVMGFPGIFRGALDVRATAINEAMKLAAARALAALVDGDLRPDYLVPSPLDPRIVPAVAGAVAEAAVASGVARRPQTAEQVAAHTRELLGHNETVVVQ